MNLGSLLVQARNDTAPVGDIKGTCVMCCRETEHGLPVRKVVSGNFMGWNKMFAGNCFCPECAYLFSDQTFRKRSWVASAQDGFRTFKNDEARDILFSPPSPPFFIHIAKRGQKQTWLSCLHKVAMDQRNYFFSHESYDTPIFFDRARAQDYIAVALSGLEKKITKRELLSGYFKPKTWRNAIAGGYRNLLEEIVSYVGDVLWEVMVDVARVGKETN